MPDIDNSTQNSTAITICDFPPCTEQKVSHCRKCNRPFCVIHSNKFSPNFCQDCFKNLQAIEGKFERVFEDYNTKTNQLTIRREANTRYYMDGMDWPFVGLWIHKLTDDEFRALWIFHFSVMKLIETENETRKVSKRKKYLEESTKLISKTTKLSTGTFKVTKPVDTAEDVRKKLKKQGLPDAIIDQMIKAMGL